MLIWVIAIPGNASVALARYLKQGVVRVNDKRRVVIEGKRPYPRVACYFAFRSLGCKGDDSAPSRITDRQATITFNSCNGLATIQLADPAILDPPEMWADFYKLEKVIAHELLHLMLVGMEDIWAHVMEELSPSARNIADKQWEIASEQPVELLANILVSLKGGDKDKSIRD